MNSEHAAEVEAGTRFEFGRNWSRFLGLLNDIRIRQAQASLQQMLGVESLHGKRFLDVGSGSGLFSLAAHNLGAQVYSFDYDPMSVSCTAELRRRYADGGGNWQVEQGSVLDDEYLHSLGQHDVVYSWGVLHHTGDMAKAFSNIIPAVAPGGQLFVAIYNDQGWISRYWRAVKKFYNKHSQTRYVLAAVHAPYLVGARWLVRVLTGRLRHDRGMSLWYDMIDRLGGYPFEFAKPAEIEALMHNQGFVLKKQKNCGRRMGCNEFVFERPR